MVAATMPAKIPTTLILQRSLERGPGARARERAVAAAAVIVVILVVISRVALTPLSETTAGQRVYVAEMRFLPP
jgi:type II secretory pathway component PulM